MTSEKKTEANRSNAKKSTGPKTAAGKDHVGHNAVKHGLNAKKHSVLPENEAKYACLIADLLERKKPKGAAEEDIVEQIAKNSVLLAQCYRADQARLFEYARLSAGQRLYEFEVVGVSVGSNLQMFDTIKKEMLLEATKDIELTEEDEENAKTMMFENPKARQATTLIDRRWQSCHMDLKRLEVRLILLQKQRTDKEEVEKEDQREREWDERMNQRTADEAPVHVPVGRMKNEKTKPKR